MAISGKPRELCIQALAAAQNIPDLAAAMLMEGNIPELDDGTDQDDYMGPEEEMMEDDGGLGQFNLTPEQLQAI